MKAYYYLAQAQLALHHPNEALQSALTAYNLCLSSASASSASNISSLVLQAKKQKWEVRERERLRRRSGMLRELEDGLREIAEGEVEAVRGRARAGEVGEGEAREEEEEVRARARRKVEELYSVFAVADPANMTRRVRVVAVLQATRQANRASTQRAMRFPALRNALSCAFPYLRFHVSLSFIYYPPPPLPPPTR